MASSEQSMVEKKLYEIIQTLNSCIWEHRLGRPVIDSWLDNFDSTGKDPEARLHGLYLLTRLLYFGKREIESLTMALYRDLVKYPILASIRRQNTNTLDVQKIEAEYTKHLKMTRFWGLGGPSESGSHILYLLRTTNGLPTELFPTEMDIHAFLKAEKTCTKITPKIILIDDFCGSGKQATDYGKAFVNRLTETNFPLSSVDLHYYSLIATSWGIDAVRKTKIFSHVETVLELDQSFKVFAENSRHFRNVPVGVTKERLKQICEHHGKRLCPRNSLGNNKSQLMISMCHNTPNNTLPVIWHDGSKDYPWEPILRRAGKKKKLKP